MLMGKSLLVVAMSILEEKVVFVSVERSGGFVFAERVIELGV